MDKTICQRRQHHCAAHGCVRECTGAAGRGELVAGGIRLGVDDGNSTMLHTIIANVAYRVIFVGGNFLYVEVPVFMGFRDRVVVSPALRLFQRDGVSLFSVGGIALGRGAPEFQLDVIRQAASVFGNGFAVFVDPLFYKGKTVAFVGHFQINGSATLVDIDVTLGYAGVRFTVTADSGFVGNVIRGGIRCPDEVMRPICIRALAIRCLFFGQLVKVIVGAVHSTGCVLTWL